MNRLFALLIAWNLAGIARVAAVFVIDRHASLGFANLTSSGVLDAFLGSPYFARSVVAMAVAWTIGEILARLFPGAGGEAGRRADRMSCFFSLLVFWTLIVFGETLDRSNLVNVMTNEFALRKRHVALFFAGAGAAALSFALWSAALRKSPRPGGMIVAATVALVACAAAPRALTGSANATSDRPNVVLITIDTLRADHVSTYGYERETTPNLDAMADAGTVYLNAISQAPNTHPSMASMTASAYPTALGGGFRYIPPGAGTLAEAFMNAGYATAAVVSNVWLKDTMGFAAGFQHFDQTSAMSEFYADEERITWKGADVVSDAAIAWLRANDDRPFFLWIHYLDPHHPYEPPESFRDRFTTDAAKQNEFLESVGRMPTREQTHWLAKAGTGEIESPEGTFQAAIDLYDAEIAFTDEQIGRVVAEIENSGAGDTVFAVTADHGEEFRDHGAWGHSHTLHRELVHVPLILRDTRTQGGGRLTDRVRILDLAPTLLRTAGVAVPPSMIGIDLREKLGDRDAVSVLTKRDMFAVERGHWKLISRDYGAEVRLYDMKSDPAEKIDVAAANPDVVAELRSVLDRELGDAARAESMSATAENLDTGTRKQLEALGYID